MKAMVVEIANGPFRETEVPTPVPMHNQVLVKICASGISPLDTKIRAGQAAHAKQPLPAVLGLDMAGVVDSVGPGVTAFRPGDEVYGMVGGVGGLQGTLAEFVVTDEALLAPKPKSLSMRQAAALPLVTITAWEGLVDRAEVKSGQTVLIHAGAGGVGYAALQIALSFGAKVFATVSDDKRAIVENLGAIAIDRYAPVERYVSEHTGGEGFDIVYDTVGGAVLDASFVAVKRYTGQVVSCLGWGTHSLAPLSFRAATYSGVFTLLPLLTGRLRANHGYILRQASKLAEQNQLQPLLAEQQFGSDNIAAAYDFVAKGSKGKVVIDIHYSEGVFRLNAFQQSDIKRSNMSEIPRIPLTSHHLIEADGVHVFYREAGSANAPVILLLHGFPTSSFQYRELIPRLADRYHVIAPDLPGFGFTDVPDERGYTYTFDSLAKTIFAFTVALKLDHYVLYVFDYGAPTGFRLALMAPERVTAIVSQNGNAYEEGLGDAWQPLQLYWREPTQEHRMAIRAGLNLEGLRHEYSVGITNPDLIKPEGYTLDAALLARPGNVDIQLDLFLDYADNVKLYPKFHEYFRAAKPPLLAIWGKYDPYFIPAGAEAFHRDLPNAVVKLLPTGHFALETHLEEIVIAMRKFLDEVDI